MHRTALHCTALHRTALHVCTCMQAVAKLFCVDAEKIEEAMITRHARGHARVHTRVCMHASTLA